MSVFPQISDFLHMEPVHLAIMKDVETGEQVPVNADLYKELVKLKRADGSPAWELVERMPGMMIQPKGAAEAALGGPYFAFTALTSVAALNKFLRRAS